MERSFAREVELLRLGDGAVFHGEGILAITKGLLQAGVSYVGGYQGAPVSHLLDVMVQARPLMDELGVKVEACSNEASAAALLGASIHYPVRGAVTWKSIVGTNVASDAVSNLSSPGVTGGALIIVGEDYGEGASVIQERSLAFALKSTLCLFDPRPEHGRMVDMVEKAFELSEASNMPAMMQLRIRACHVRGTFVCRDNVAPAISQKHPFDEPASFDYAKLPHPPATFRQEKLKGEARITAARAFIVEHALNDIIEARDGSMDPASATAGIGIIVQGGLYNTLMGALVQCGLADAFGEADVALLVLNVTCPLAPVQIETFCRDRTAVVVVEEGQPEFLEQEIATILRRAGIATALHGKDVLPQAGEYNVEIVAAGLARVVELHAQSHDVSAVTAWLADNAARRTAVAARFEDGLPTRPPGFCIGCPERPVFSALKQVQERIGRVHVAADIGCHSFATFEPFSSGHTILGYGMSLASAGGVGPMMTRRSIAIMGDGGFWHNGLLSGVQSALFNEDDTVLLILKNGYTSATGTQEIISTPADDLQSTEVSRIKPGSQQLTANNNAIEETLTGMGVKWLKTVYTYDVDAMMKALTEAFTTEAPGLKVIVGEGECQLERQRRIKPVQAARLKAGKRTQRVKYGVDENTCSGDHSCIRLSGCPTLTLKDSDDPLKVDPVVTITEGCVGCGLCGSNAHAATLCPSFYRIEVTQNPTRWDRLRSWMTTSAVARGSMGAA